MKKLLLGLFLVFLLAPAMAHSAIGVGVGTGKVVIDEKLKPGLIYNLPSVMVLNTGDEPSDYELAMTYNEKQPQLKPPEGWFIFSPKRFHLEPGQSQAVSIKLNLPLSVTPGDYYGYLEAHPIKEEANGVSSVNIAAAAKLYFTVVPANILQAIYYKVVSFWHVYSPWPQRAALVIGGVVLILIIKKFFHIEVRSKKKSHSESHESDE